MIRIQRGQEPEVLRTQGVTKRAELEASASRGEQLAFDGGVYAHTDVKAALVAMQHEKCAFCEAKPLHVSSGDVEHFRPKAAVRQDEGAPLQRPGYFWLAYAWENLLFSCERCNRRHKGNLFPLVDPTCRARAPSDDLTAEEPFFVDPSAEDPELHITFREHVPCGLTERGKATILALGLDRRELNRDREESLQRLRLIASVAALDVPGEALRADARDLLRKALEPRAEYARMCRVAFPPERKSADTATGSTDSLGNRCAGG